MTKKEAEKEVGAPPPAKLAPVSAATKLAPVGGSRLTRSLEAACLPHPPSRSLSKPAGLPAIQDPRLHAIVSYGPAVGAGIRYAAAAPLVWRSGGGGLGCCWQQTLRRSLERHDDTAPAKPATVGAGGAVPPPRSRL